jgi:hypothetical protein
MNDERDLLHSSAASARAVLGRLAGPQGVLEQIERGEWDNDLSGRSATGRAAALLQVAAESARYSREALGALRKDGTWTTEGPVRIVRDAAERRLPFNRKERYFTGTVFPMVVASDGFAHLDRLLDLCGLDGVHVEPGLNAEQDLQFFTEYSFRESIFSAADRARFVDPPEGGDTPDIVVCGSDWLLAIEAKMYDQPTVVSLNTQLSRQWAFVAYWADALGIASGRVAHVALLPAALSRRLGDLVRPTLTWEALADTFRDVAPRYWLGQLDYANTAGLAADATAQFGANAHGHRTGQEILDGHRYPGPSDLTDLDPRAAFDYMGRGGGLDGKALSEDIATGRWRTQTYEVRQGDAPNPNWFLIEDFLERVAMAGR